MTQFNAHPIDPMTLTGIETLIISITEDATFSETATAVDNALGGRLTELKNQHVLSGKSETSHVIYTLGKLVYSTVIVVGLGAYSKINEDTIRHVAGDLSRTLKSLKSATSTWALDTPLSLESLGEAIAMGVLMGSYRYDQYRSKPDPTFLISNVTVVGENVLALETGLTRGKIIGESVNISRNLANAPANDMTPTRVVSWMKATFPAGCGIDLEIIDAAEAKRLGMNLFLAVAQGSAEPPFMGVLRYTPKPGEKPIGLIGKGVTFDSGGISIKPSAKMSEMKGDMSGAAAVLATMSAVKTLKPAQNIIAVVALTENMPSGTAYRPSDILTGMNGKTVEITNTDAEGRLVLADALSYAISQGAKELVDIATLTGACSVALGDVSSAILGNNQVLIDRWLNLSLKTGERLWQLPLYDDYFEYLKSDVADMLNASEGRLAGTCTGAKFLEQFVGDTPWVHLDIASMMYFSKTKGYTVKGMSGVGVRNLIGYVM